MPWIPPTVTRSSPVQAPRRPPLGPLPYAGQAPASPVACTPGPSFATLVITGAIATGIVMWIRERGEEHRAEKDHDAVSREIDELDLELAAEEENTQLALEQARVRGLLLHGYGPATSGGYR